MYYMYMQSSEECFVSLLNYGLIITIRRHVSDQCNGLLLSFNVHLYQYTLYTHVAFKLISCTVMHALVVVTWINDR